jgi:hypothetical protein
MSIKRLSHIKNAPYKSTGYLSVRTGYGGNGVGISWIKQNQLPKTSIKPGGPTVFSTSFKKSRTSISYPRASVLAAGMQGYEETLLDTFEPQFALIQEKAKHITDMSRKFSYFSLWLQKTM